MPQQVRLPRCEVFDVLLEIVKYTLFGDLDRARRIHLHYGVTILDLEDCGDFDRAAAKLDVQMLAEALKTGQADSQVIISCNHVNRESAVAPRLQREGTACGGVNLYRRVRDDSSRLVKQLYEEPSLLTYLLCEESGADSHVRD